GSRTGGPAPAGPIPSRRAPDPVRRARSRPRGAPDTTGPRRRGSRAASRRATRRPRCRPWSRAGTGPRRGTRGASRSSAPGSPGRSSGSAGRRRRPPGTRRATGTGPARSRGVDPKWRARPPAGASREDSAVADQHRVEVEVAAERDRVQQLPAETAAQPRVPGEVTLDPDGERVGETELLAQPVTVDGAEGVEGDTVGHHVHR